MYPNSTAAVILEFCDAIIRQYGEEFVACSTYPENRKAIEQGFREQWNVPHTIDTLDRKHIPMRCPGGGEVNIHLQGLLHKRPPCPSKCRI